jgi:hypothetical protein
MTTPRIRSLVSLAAALTITLALGGCASAPVGTQLDQPTPTDASPLVVRFDNEARDYVRVYLVGVQREWLLGRVEPGGRAKLRIPDAALAENAGSMYLAALVGDRTTLQAAGDARAVMLATGELTPRPLDNARPEVGHQ